ncbi:hypothetical protein L1280_003096 [Deinococcus sp. HSC-46F16]|uniref:hypothetical protein n=1 Tax=Deinococcus sp. HSC-46F16 TaxID=2910968 RepID=UPI00209D4442|nr:hypothetical protein [Deinococcus sp. HSC-46F16]MCP2015913.1 hypothetical protein [Deinococcus sp. HSC-46F16]
MFQDITMDQLAEETGRQYKQVAKLVAEYRRVAGVEFEGDGSRKLIPREVADVLVAVVSKVGPEGRLSYRMAIEETQIEADRARILAQPADILRTIRAVEISVNALERLLAREQLQRPDIDLIDAQFMRIARRLRHLLAECDGLILEDSVSTQVQVELLHVVRELAALFRRISLFDATLATLRASWRERDDSAYAEFQAFVAARAQPPFLPDASPTEASKGVEALAAPGYETGVATSTNSEVAAQGTFPFVGNDAQVFLDSWCDRYPDLNSGLFKGDQPQPACLMWEARNNWIPPIG